MKEGLTCLVCGQPYRNGLCDHGRCRTQINQEGATRHLPFEPRPAGESRPSGEVFLARPKPIILEIDGKSFTITLRNHLVVGRHSDLADDPAPDVDLSPFHADEKGVSRRHLRIRCPDYLIYVTDLGSRNGTWLNGHLILPGAERLLRSGDELQLGALHIRIKFWQSAAFAEQRPDLLARLSL